MAKLIIKNLILILLPVIIFFGNSNNVWSEEKEIKESVAKKADVCEKIGKEGDTWVDSLHAFMNVEFCEPSVWFDSFFSDERSDEELRAGSHIRWQNDYILTRGGQWEYVSNVHASFKLPKAKKSVHIVFEGEEEDDLEDIVPSDKEEIKSDLGVLYEVKKTARANFNVRVKLSPSITFRYRYQLPITDTFDIRYTQELYRRNNADGTSSRIDFEKLFYKGFFLRQSNSILRSESFQGEKWYGSLVLYHSFSDKSALSLESSTSGVTIPEKFTKNTRLGIRYRRNFYRKWLFYEIAPAVNRDKTLITDERVSSWEILFRLEVNFINY